MNLFDAVFATICKNLFLKGAKTVFGEISVERRYFYNFMGKSLLLKLKEALLSVSPVFLIVLILSFTPLVNLSTKELMVFIFSTVLLIIGIALFSLGSDLAMMPMGDYIGAGLTKSKSLGLLLIISFVMGFCITVAEPDLTVLANQVASKINPTVLIISVAAGVGFFLLIAVLKIVLKKPLFSMLSFFYMCLFAVAAVLLERGNGSFIAVAFDSGGVTTGPITVPFIMALGIGIAATIGGKHSQENSFGLIALCSVGPILAVLILALPMKGSLDFALPSYEISENFFASFFKTLLSVVKEVGIALGLIVLFFAILQAIFLKLPKTKLYKIGVGVIITFFGLVIFLTAVSVGFMPIGFKLGTELATASPIAVVIVGFILGLVVVMAEPAVHVLNKQVEDITDGLVKKRSMMIALSIGVGISLLLSMIRIIYDFSILYYLIPGYIISLGLSFFVPSLYTGIAFDSGGVASGPLTSSFILPFAIGVCVVLQGEAKVLADAFGIVAMVAMTPLIAIQTLGFEAIMRKRVSDAIAMQRILSADDEQIINFM